MIDNIIFISGLPRTGSTLLQQILLQNKNFYSEINSGLCQMMWDVNISFDTNLKEYVVLNKRDNLKHNIMSELPKIYYKENLDKFIFDKCRTWTLEENIKIIKKYISKEFKMIVLVRPIDEIIKSFLRINKNNTLNFLENSLLVPGTDPVMRPFAGLYTIKNNSEYHNNILYIRYDDLVFKTVEVVERIYSFIGVPYYTHSFNFIEERLEYNDSFYNLNNMHKVRSHISKSFNNEIKLDKETEIICNRLNELIDDIS
jgi:sulfotransferase